MAVRIGGEIHAPADVLAGEIEERLGRLQDRGRDARVAGALEGGDERLRPRVGRDALACRFGLHTLGLAFGGASLARAGYDFDAYRGMRVNGAFTMSARS